MKTEENVTGRRCALLERVIDRDAEPGEMVYGVVVATAKLGLLHVAVNGRTFAVRRASVKLADEAGRFRERVSTYACSGDDPRAARIAKQLD